MNQPITYKDAGVDIDAKNEAFRRIKDHLRSTFTAGVVSDVGAFGSMFALDAGPPPVLVASADGVGTKLKIAFALDRHRTVGIDIVSHCVNDILVQGARPLFFLDYIATGRLRPDVLEQVVSGLAEGCRQAGCALIGGETAEMPGFYGDNEYDLAGFIVGAVQRDRIIDGKGICPGDAILGLASSGLHTNGYSLARKVLLEVAGIGLEEAVPLLGRSLGDELLEPHRSYAASVLPVMEKVSVKGMAHITGGGFYDNIPRILPEGCQAVIDASAWPVPPVFRLIREKGQVPDREMYRTFNMGVGLVLFVGGEEAEESARLLRERGETVYRIGEVSRGEKKTVVKGIGGE
ncbi:MAG: phosphoribosylformylglycinamidine cyclo-ligase [Armatimonadetes bacterium]|nr:phosphoribosylformylglycinamidine cyclo-ligase [Armatimonadota bacterium]